jgi:Arc/MetJ family transcription regulator
MAASRDKTIDVDAGLLADTRDAMKLSVYVEDSEVVERVLRLYLGRRAVNASQAMSGLSEEDAMRVASTELRAMRSEGRSVA